MSWNYRLSVFCVLVISAFVVAESVVLGQTANSCKTPLNEDGLCTNIQFCPTFANMRRNGSINSRLNALFSQSICRVESGRLLVCCALSDLQVTARPTVVPRLYSGDDLETYTLPDETVCGKTNLSPSFFRDQRSAAFQVPKGTFSFITLLGYEVFEEHGVDYLCTGALITSRHVLTAAHCLHVLPNLTIARTGIVNLFDKPEYEGVIVEKHINENYDFNTQENDIALLKVKWNKDIDFHKISPICLPTSTVLEMNRGGNQHAYVTGWGLTSYVRHTFDDLEAFRVPIIPNSVCKSDYWDVWAARIVPNVICAGDVNLCKADSGSPLMLPVETEANEVRIYALGIFSYGYKCDQVGHPDVFTRVSSYLDWIISKLN